MPETGTALQPYRKHALHLFLILATVMGVFAHTLFFDFVWDDKLVVLQSPAYRTFDLKKIFLSMGNEYDYLPVRDFSFALDFLLWGEHPLGFHATNVLIYLATIWFVYLATMRISLILAPDGRPEGSCTPRHLTIAITSALLFAVHPLHCEVVSFVSHRNMLLYGLFFFMCCHYHLKALADSRRARTLGYQTASLMFFLLALLSKQSAIVLPFILFMLTWFHGRLTKNSAVVLLPYFGLAGGAYFLFKRVAEAGGLIAEEHHIFFAQNVTAKIAAALQIPYFYAWKFLVPLGISVEYTNTFSSASVSMQVTLAAAGVLAALVAFVALRKRYPYLLFCAGWVFVTLIPFLHLFQTYPVVADRYFYIPSYAPILLGSILLSRLKSPHVARTTTIMVLLVWSVIAVRTNMAWSTEESLYLHSARHVPDNPKMLRNLGILYWNEKRYEEAFTSLKKIKETLPFDVTFEYYRGRHLLQEGHREEAMEYLAMATQDIRGVGFAKPAAHFLLAQTKDKQGDRRGAISHYLEAAKGTWHPNTRSFAELAQARYEELVREELEALSVLRAEVEGKPSDLNALLKLALEFDRIGLYDEALAVYSQLEHGGGAHWALYLNMGNVYKKLGDYKSAIICYQQSIQLNDTRADTFNNLASVYEQTGKYEQAVEAYLKAMEIDPAFQLAPYNLSKLYYRLGEREKSRHYMDLMSERFPDWRKRISILQTRMVD
jgi:tetratricopeptide (TPR) repeat protein